MVSDLQDVVFQTVRVLLFKSVGDSRVHLLTPRAGRAGIQYLPDKRVGKAERAPVGQQKALLEAEFQRLKKLFFIGFGNGQEQRKTEPIAQERCECEDLPLEGV